MQRQTTYDDEIVTVNTASNNTAQPQDDILDRLSSLPQVKQPKTARGLEDQLWRELTSYSQGGHG